MARALRPAFEGARYHTTSRGNGKERCREDNRHNASKHAGLRLSEIGKTYIV